MTNEVKNSPVGAVLQDELLTLDAAADYLAVSKPTLYRMLDRSEVKGIKVGRQWRFRQSDLDAYLSRGPVAVALSTVPMDVLDRELDFYADEFRKIERAAPEIEEAGGDPWEEKVTLLITRMARLAAASGSSDIHLEPLKEAGELFGLLRYRIDGILHTVRRMPIRLYEAVIMRCRTLAEAEPIDRTFLDARIELTDQDGGIELRIGVMLGQYGDVLTARLRVESSAEEYSLDRLGFFPEDLARLRDWLRPHGGLIMTAGPTGCGKSTLMYAMLREVAGPERKTVTIEDPIELRLPWVTQMEVRGNVSFINALRAILRHDVDAIMIGEMRDLETISAAITAAQTGHQVFSNVHVENTLRTIDRMIDVFPVDQQDQITYMLTSLANRFIAIRLVRVLCPQCKQPADVSNAALAQAGQLARAGGYPIPEDAAFYTAVGCDRCRGIGYQGRTWIYEMLEMTPKLREAFLRKAPLDEKITIAIEEGLCTIAANGIRKAVAGITSIDEVLRIFGG